MSGTTCWACYSNHGAWVFTNVNNKIIGRTNAICTVTPHKDEESKNNNSTY